MFALDKQDEPKRSDSRWNSWSLVRSNLGASAQMMNSNAGRVAFISVLYLIVYLALNTVTDFRQIGGTGITIWSPDNGLSLLLLMYSRRLIPIVMLGDVCADIFIHHVHQGLFLVFASEAALACSYMITAYVLCDLLRFDLESIRLDNVIKIISVAPFSTALPMIFFCGLIYVFDSISTDNIYLALYEFWIGDVVGIVVIIPLAIALRHASITKPQTNIINAKDLSIIAVLLLFTCTVSVVVTSVDIYRELFYLFFLPAIWMAMRYGYLGSSLFVFFTQVSLVAAVAYFRVSDEQFVKFQTLMLVLSATGLLMGAVISERAYSASLIRQQRSSLTRLSEQNTTAAMASTMAHEISQPLAAMALYVHAASLILENEPTSQTTVEARKALKKVEDLSGGARRIIERIRDFVSNGKLELEPVNLVDLAEKIAALTGGDFRRRGVEVVVEKSEPSIIARGDPTALELALNNIVINAIDAAGQRDDSQGRVTIEVSRRDRKALVHVDDNGIGVSPEIADKIFETFVTTKSNGMGLGLPLAHQIANRHSGQLTWNRREPQGTRFTLELPIDGPGKDVL